MSSSINALNGNGVSLQFEEFARLAGKSSNVVRFLGSADAASVHEVSVTKSDKVGKLFRSDGVKTANETTRAIFHQSVAAMFGGEDHIPENVKKANHLFLGTNGGTLCQNPETDAYVLMRPVPLAPLEGAEAMGAILEETLAQVERWHDILGGIREAEATLAQTADERPSFDSGTFMQV